MLHINKAALLVRMGGTARTQLALTGRRTLGPAAASLATTHAEGQVRNRTFSTTSEKKTPSHYWWVEEEAKQLISDAYNRHLFPPSHGKMIKELETITDRLVPHYKPQSLSDRVALKFVGVLEKAMSLFFRTKYDHHAVTLETVAAVPGFVAAMHRHLRSLRRMAPDHEWIEALLEESQNERLHLLIWMQHTHPNLAERAFVLAAQGVYVSFYSVLYVFSPRTAHRTVGVGRASHIVIGATLTPFVSQYLEEAAIRAYTEYLHAVDHGEIPNVVLPPNSIAAKYYHLPPGSRLRDVILHVRADEAYHAIYNHGLSDQIRDGGIDKDTIPLEDDVASKKKKSKHQHQQSEQPTPPLAFDEAVSIPKPPHTPLRTVAERIEDRA